MLTFKSKFMAVGFALGMGGAATLGMVVPGQSEGTYLGQMRGSSNSIVVLGPMAPKRISGPADQLDRRAANHNFEQISLSKNTSIDPLSTGAVASSFFGTVAVAFANVSGKDDWNRVSKAGIAPAQCKNSACNRRVDALQAAVQNAQDEGFHALLRAVNSNVNRLIAYAPDQQTYGRKDFWATPARIVDKGVGDCEDFAILKRALLRQAGVPDKSMSMVILKDQQRGLYHAVLAVSTNKGHFILDNVRTSIFVDKTVSHYMPLLSFSADRSWIHGMAGKKPMLVSATDAIAAIAPGESWAAAEPLTPDVHFEDLRPSISY